jgi:thioesterase domain-containing protein
LLAARLIDGLRESFGASVSLIEFLESDVTVAGLAARIEGVVDPTSTPSGRPVTPLFFVYPDMNSAVSARHLIRAWGAERPIYPLIPGQPGGQFDRSGGVEGLVRPLLAEIRQVQPSGPYLLAGFSLGGLLTYDIARQLAEAGHQVDWTGVVDCPTPRVAGALYEEVPVTLRQRYRRLRGRSRAERRAKYREVLMRTARGGPQAFRSVEAFDYLGALDISRRYARSYPGIVHLFATAGSAEEVDDPSLGWAEFHPGPLDVCELAGDHWTVLDQPQIDDVAKAMRKSLDDAHSRMPMPAAECPSGSPAS